MPSLLIPLLRIISITCVAAAAAAAAVKYNSRHEVADVGIVEFAIVVHQDIDYGDSTSSRPTNVVDVVDVDSGTSNCSAVADVLLIKQHEEDHQNSNSSIAVDTASSVAVDDHVAISDYNDDEEEDDEDDEEVEADEVIQYIIELYQDIVSKHVPKQLDSWIEAVQYVHDTRQSNEVSTSPHEIEGLYPGIEKLKRRMNAYDESPTSPMEEEAAATSRIMIWDNAETDIDTYFDTLLNKCSKDFKDQQHSCWNYILDLLYAPRCTTRLDSRYKCDGGEMVAVADIDVVEVESMIRQHFAVENNPDHYDTVTKINIVVVGAGPTGLLLAGKFLELSLDSIDTGEGSYQFRILVLESRIEDINTPGQKKPYTRDYMTGILLSCLPKNSKIRHLLHKLGWYTILSKQTTNDEIALPINVLETLLLLELQRKHHNHNRNDHDGDIVKFIYDSDPVTKYEAVLSTIPNLLVFDATGNRLLNNEESNTNDDRDRDVGSNLHDDNESSHRFSTFTHISTIDNMNFWIPKVLSHGGGGGGGGKHTNPNRIFRTEMTIAKHTQGVRNETLLYPVDTIENSSGSSSGVTPNDDNVIIRYRPYTYRWLKLNGMIMPHNVLGGAEYGYISTDAFTKKTKGQLYRHPYNNFCNRICLDLVSHDMNKGYGQQFYDLMQLCDDSCSLVRYHREDIFYRLYNITGSSATDSEEFTGNDNGNNNQNRPRFSTELAFISLSPKEYDILSYLLDYKVDTVKLNQLSSPGILDEVKRTAMVTTSESRKRGNLDNDDNRVNTIVSNAFDAIQNVAMDSKKNRQSSNAATVSTFTMTPYIYENPLVPGGIFGGHPLLRVGDSLFTGDPNIGTGLNAHNMIILQLMSQVRYGLEIP